MNQSKRLPTAVIALALASLLGLTHAAELPSPAGLWKTVDDKNGQARGFVRVYESDGKFFAKIETSFAAGDETRTCSACTDERKNQPIVGLVIMRNMKAKGEEFVDGDILDPDSGSIYRCKFRLEDGGKRLAVRGFIGVSLFGRSQTWFREQ